MPSRRRVRHSSQPPSLTGVVSLKRDQFSQGRCVILGVTSPLRFERVMPVRALSDRLELVAGQRSAAQGRPPRRSKRPDQAAWSDGHGVRIFGGRTITVRRSGLLARPAGKPLDRGLPR